MNRNSFRRQKIYFLALYEDYDLFISDSNVKTICWRKLTVLLFNEYLISNDARLLHI